MRVVCHHILTIMVLLLSSVYAAGKDSLDVRRVNHDISLALSAGYNLPSHGYFRGYNPLDRPIYANTSLHLQYAFGLTDATRLGRLYPGVKQGIGISGCTFYDDELMGTPAFAYIFQNARIYEFKPGFGLDYSWNLGASYGWRKSEMIATAWNIYVNVGLLLSWDMSPDWTIGFGPDFTHCSNGDTAYPNGGANLFNMKVLLTSHLGRQSSTKDRTDIIEYESRLRQKKFADRITYDLIICGGYRAGKLSREVYALINRPFPCFGLNFMPMYHLNRIFSLGASLDVVADRSADLYDVVLEPGTREVLSYSQPPLYRQIAAGLSLRGDITMPFFTIGAGVGCFLPGCGHSLKGLYTSFALKAFVTERLFLNVTYRLSSLNYTHNLMYGLGWRFN